MAKIDLIRSIGGPLACIFSDVLQPASVCGYYLLQLGAPLESWSIVRSRSLL